MVEEKWIQTLSGSQGKGANLTIWTYNQDGTENIKSSVEGLGFVQDEGVSK